MFERFTDQARRCVVLAQEEARLLGHDYIGTEHLLLGLLRDPTGVGGGILTAHGIELEAMRTRVEEIIGRGRGAVSGHVPFTPRAKKVLEMSLREAITLGDRFIGSEHVLLGLLREGEGVGAQVLVARGVRLDSVRTEVARLDPGVRREMGAEDPEATLVTQIPEPYAGIVEHLSAEATRLRDLLAAHGIDPDGPVPPEPGLGEDGGPPVA